MLKVVVIGPESTGKSTLSERLAGHYQTIWVPEYARQYLEELPRSYAQQDLLKIAEGQLALEDEREKLANKLLICDTDLHVVKVWSEHKFGNCDPRILEMMAMRKYDLYLLTYIDIPWEEDPQREYPDPAMREYFYRIYKDIVASSGIPWAEVHGNYEERLEMAIRITDALLQRKQA